MLDWFSSTDVSYERSFIIILKYRNDSDILFFSFLFWDDACKIPIFFMLFSFDLIINSVGRVPSG